MVLVSVSAGSRGVGAAGAVLVALLLILAKVAWTQGMLWDVVRGLRWRVVVAVAVVATAFLVTVARSAHAVVVLGLGAVVVLGVGARAAVVVTGASTALGGFVTYPVA